MGDVERILGRDRVAAVVDAVEVALVTARGQSDGTGAEALSTLLTALLAMVVMEPSEGADARAEEYAARLIEAVAEGRQSGSGDIRRLC